MSVSERSGDNSGVPPSVSDAERAAEVLVAAGVSRVVLFGSVARGDQTVRSDIDLVAIYDDLDYDQREDLIETLQEAAGEASGYPVELVVTDRPEWKVRTEGIQTSTERRVASYGRVLVDRPAAGVDWDKPMVAATNDLEEARSTLGAVDWAVMQLRSYRLGAIKNRRDPDEYWTALLWACAAAYAAVADSVRALIHLAAVPGSTTWGHDIDELLGRLVEPHRTNFHLLLRPPDPYVIGMWREKTIPDWSEYPRPRPTRDGHKPAVRLVEALAWAACRAALYADAHIPAEENAGRIGWANSPTYRLIESWRTTTYEPADSSVTTAGVISPLCTETHPDIPRSPAGCPPTAWRCSSSTAPCPRAGRPLGRNPRRLPQDLIRPPQLTVLPPQPLQLRQLIRTQPSPQTLITLSLANPPTQRLRRTAELGSDRTDRRPLRTVLPPLL